MAKSVIPRKSGDKYQALFFWLQACKVLSNNSTAVRVGYEIDTHSGFDDVAIYYDPQALFNGQQISQEYFQLKFHSDHKNGVTSNSLISTDFIGTKNHTILTRLWDIYQLNPENYVNSQFHFITTWGIDYSNGLSELLNADGSINGNKLKKGGAKSKFGKIRQSWMNSLGTDEDSLFTIVKSLRISTGFSFERLIMELNDSLENARLIKLDSTKRSSVFVDLINTLHGEGKTQFSKSDIYEACVKEGLFSNEKSATAQRLNTLSYDEIKKKFQEQTENQLKKSYFSLKYDTSRYIQREIEKEVTKWLSEPIENASKVFLILAAAGCGKTNLLSQIAKTNADRFPVLLIAAPLVRLGTLGIWELLYDLLHISNVIKSRTSILAYFQNIFHGNGKKLIIVIDAINEYYNPSELKNELAIFLEEIENIGFSIIISCRDFYWGLFDSDWWPQHLKTNSAGNQSQNKKHLGNYSTSEVQNAFQLYFNAYNITAKPIGNALEQFRHPLLLRFFCETYTGQKIGELKDVRLKNLFDTYWDKKLKSIAERIINQGLIERKNAIESRLGENLKEIALIMLENNTRAIEESEAQKMMQTESPGLLLATPLGRIIDEHIILEEIDLRGYDSKILIAFVFEEFMEYSMARALYSKWINLQMDEICSQVKLLTDRYGDFNQIFGVLLYFALMLKEKRNIALWPSLILQGDTWQRLVVESFKKLQPDQIDDGVFSAMIELLELKNESIQIATLELLKFGRLKRGLPEELMTAIGKLVTHKKLTISRRAIIILADFPPSEATVLIENAISKSRSRQDDEATIVKNSIKILAGLHTDSAILSLCRICGGFWRIYNLDEVIQKLGSFVEKLIPLLDHEEILVRLGAIKLVGFTANKLAFTILQNKIALKEYNTKIYTRNDLPEWVKSLSYSWSENWIEPDTEKNAIEKAILDLQESIKKEEANVFWRNKIQEITQTKIFDDLPQLFEELTSYYSNSSLIRFIIQSGIEIRSNKKWRLVKGNFRSIMIRAPHTRMKNNIMEQADAIELAKLLGLEKIDNDGCEIRVGINDNNFWKEYMYRAWGFEPPTLGYTDYYD